MIKNQLNKFRSLPLDSYHQETVSNLLTAETSLEVQTNFVGLHELVVKIGMSPSVSLWHICFFIKNQI